MPLRTSASRNAFKTTAFLKHYCKHACKQYCKQFSVVQDDSYVVELHRDFETLHDVSIEPLDRIQVHAAFGTGSGRTRRWKPRAAHI